MLNKHILVIFFFASLMVNITAQVKINSPISILGFGQLSEQNHMHVLHSGELNATYYKSDQLNSVNPASLSALRTAVFEGGVSAGKYNLENGDVKSDYWSGRLSYLSIGVPLQNQINAIFNREQAKLRWGMGFELKPYSITGFDFEFEEETSTTDRLRRYKGQGATYLASWSNGWSYEKLKFGVQLGYHFGSTDLNNQVFLEQTDINGALNFVTTEINQINFKGFDWNVGATYDFVFSYSEQTDGSKGDPNKYLTLGATYNGNSSLTTTSDEIFYRLNATASNVLLTDTLSSSFGVKGTAELPSEMQFGFNYTYKKDWSAGMNFRHRAWSKYKNDARPETEDLADAFRISAGISMTPDYNSITSFWQRASYSLGVHYEKDPRKLNGEQLDGYGLKAGFNFPIYSQRQTSYLHLGFGLGKLTVDKGYQENYFTISLGYSLTDNQWFLKRKYE